MSPAIILVALFIGINILVLLWALWLDHCEEVHARHMGKAMSAEWLPDQSRSRSYGFGEIGNTDAYYRSEQDADSEVD